MQRNDITQTITASRCALHEHAIEFQGQRFEPDATKAYVEFYLAHAYPVVTSYQSAFHPGTIQRSHRTMLHQVFDLRHLVASYFKGTPNEIREDRIIGSVLGVEFPDPPVDGWSMTDAEQAPGIRGLAVIHKQAKGMDTVLGAHQSGRHQWTVSLEVDYRLSESAILLVPTEKAKEMDPALTASTPPLYAMKGLHCLSFMDAPEDLIGCWDEKRGMFTRPFRGWKPITLLGGVDGQIHFKGVGLVEYGAEPAARLGQMLAEDTAWATTAEALRRICERVERL